VTRFEAIQMQYGKAWRHNSTVLDFTSKYCARLKRQVRYQYSRFLGWTIRDDKNVACFPNLLVLKTKIQTKRLENSFARKWNICPISWYTKWPFSSPNKNLQKIWEISACAFFFSSLKVDWVVTIFQII